MSSKFDMSANIWKELRIRLKSVHLCVLIVYVFIMVYFYEHYDKSHRLPMYEKKMEKLKAALEKLELSERETQELVNNMTRILDKKKTIEGKKDILINIHLPKNISKPVENGS